jgi:hypothetical protein
MSLSRCAAILSLALLLALGASLVGCSDDDDSPSGPAETAMERVQRVFPTSIHSTRPGKATFYEAPDGFVTLTGVPITEMGCTKCHGATYADGTAIDHETYVPGCKDCHADPDNPTATPVADATCLGCHGRQGAEQNLFSDVHRAAGMNCIACHKDTDMHGDGNTYASFLESGALDARCESCHTTLASNIYHSKHAATVSCSACHVKSVSSCYNCHFETEIQIDKKRFFAQAPRTGFKMLMNWEGKVHTATFQTLSYEGNTFVAIAPFFGHSITRDDIHCGDCHLFGDGGNPILREYQFTGKIVVTRWDPAATGAARLVGPTGVIPIVPDWQSALQFDFLTYTGSPSDPVNGPANLPLWDYLKTGADGSHIVYGTPLTAEQMEHLYNY